MSSQPVREGEAAEDDEGKSQAQTNITDGKTLSTTDQRRGSESPSERPPTLVESVKKNKGCVATV